MKKGIAMLFVLLLALTSTALAVTQDEAVSLAMEAVGGNAELVRVERDDGEYEIRLQSADANHEVKVLGFDGAVLEVQTRYLNAGWANAFDLTEEEAMEAAKAVVPEAAQGVVIRERDDGSCVYEVFYAANGAIGRIDVNAQTGAIACLETYPAAAAQGVISAADVVRLVAEQQPNAEIVELELSWDDGGYQFDGEVSTGGFGRLSFEMDAVTGRIWEWERD